MINDTGSSTQAAGIPPLEGSRKRTRGNESVDQEESTANMEATVKIGSSYSAARGTML
jgi:hypothetical protein